MNRVKKIKAFMKLRLLLPLFSLYLLSLSAQSTAGLVAHYRFDGDLTDATGNSTNTGSPVGTPDYACGVVGQSLLLDGTNDQVRVISTTGVNNEFDTEDFSVSFYFKPIGINGTQYLLSKRDTACGVENYFFIRYVPLTRTLNVVLNEGAQQINLIKVINNQACWQHVAVVREKLRVRLYLNGEFAGDLGASSRVDVSNNGSLLIGGANCRATGNETTFAGLLDELRIYNRALKEDEVKALYVFPDQIVTANTKIFLGNSVDIELNSNCGNQFSWTPTGDVISPFEAEPTIQPSQAGVFAYYVQISDNVSPCVATDSIQIIVIDPNTLDCSQIFMPRAFTPNGDNINDTYGISNAEAIPELLSFEIFDRWGSRVFFTTDALEEWDGTFQGQPVNPGTMLWKVRYRCNDEELQAAGNVTILK